MKINHKNKKIYQNIVYPLAGTILTALLLTVVIESLSRASLYQALLFFKQKPLLFFLNFAVILITLSISLLTARRKFFFLTFTGIWLVLGIVNRVVQCFRLTPISAMDLYQASGLIKTLPVYFNTIGLIFIGLLLLAGVAFLFILWRKLKKSKRLVIAPVSLLVLASFLFILLFHTVTKENMLQKEFDNLRDAYLEYGFAYCFTNSIFERGIDRPKDYSKKRMEEVLDQIENETDKLYTGSTAKAEKPNIIMVQLESFFDVSYFKNYTFSENPAPNFTKLKENCPSGFLKVPVYGAGTVNTEFEVMTGMSMEFFGTGEYPYRTVLRSKTCESIPYNLDRNGYRSFVIHNNTATFYNRNDVFPMLGFDYFDSCEYMNGLIYNKIGWPKDEVLTGEILKALNSDAERDYIYTITVQSHGIYLDKEQDDAKIKVTPSSGNIAYPDNLYKSLSGYVNAIEYYVNELNETDRFIGELTESLSKYEEPTVVVFYGDHLPPLSLKQEDITNDRHSTEYVIWSNFPMEKTRYDLSAYQLGAYVFNRLGMEDGILAKFHQRCFEDANYRENLKLLQYDLLYGKKYVFNQENPNKKTDMSMGIYQPEVKEITRDGDNLLIKGSGFTECSTVIADGKRCKTEFINDTLLKIPYRQLEGKQVYVEQLAGEKTVLGKSKAFKYE
ncbi:LTA synthase family protein [Anaerocolumna xylanovorans]|uniref:Phosphoglycerol transferase MdoB n=1 Tax=Anaerocolumna xylanovorans DSM 12503 TaxID=1121345 RepID=A0A1M7XWY7_9FIRM|nr:LTA synthase family protein [Anaerocolumna xylanovorans]SHO43290.1 Phosphoglycerol transferase MdoB [Anaerocolumna xylanovorans DSM 12503]